jgi:Family of unknown function (DUF5706)
MLEQDMQQPQQTQTTHQKIDLPPASKAGVANAANNESAHFSSHELTLRLDQAWRVLGVNQEIIRSADQKIYLLLVCSALLVTFVANNIERILNLGLLQNILLMAFLLSSATFFFFALRTLFARGDIKANSAHKGVIFFGDIYRHGSPDRYLNDVRNIPLNDFFDDLVKQAYYVSEIATRKYTAYRRAWLGLMGEVVAFLLLEVSIVFLAR